MLSGKFLLFGNSAWGFWEVKFWCMDFGGGLFESHVVVLGPKMGQRNKKTLCDPPYDFRDKGDNMLTTRFHLKTKEILKSRL